MQRLFIFAITWIVIAFIVMPICYIAFRLSMKMYKDFDKLNRKKRRKRKHEK